MATVKLGIMFFLYSVVLNNEDILISFGFDHRSNFVSLMLFFKLYESLGFIMNKMTNQYIRKIEYQADEYAAELGPHAKKNNNKTYKVALHHALIKIFKSNKSSLSPDTWYSALNNTHPTLLERLRNTDYDPVADNESYKPMEHPDNTTMTTIRGRDLNS
jgi:STE24 endopeptidase